LAPIASPDEALRTQIVATKAAALGLDLGAELSGFVAAAVRGNVREIQGVLNAIRARAIMGAHPITRATIREALGVMGVCAGGGGPDVATILEVAAVEFGVTPGEIVSPRRTARLAEARQAAMFLCREHTELPLATIGQRLGGRDHSTVVYAVARVTERLAAQPIWQERLDRMRKRLAASRP
jgi:chromosomal replication initiator protein